MKRNTAILLAAGKGRRMGGNIPKQYMELKGEPLLFHSLRALASSPVITELVLVIPDGDEAYVRNEIVGRLPEKEREKVRAFAVGGAERYDSVQNGIRAIDWPCDLVFIHDGARPFIDHASLERLEDAAGKYGAAVAGMPTKDTVKIADENGFVKTTPQRSLVWIIQTPQVFSYELIRNAYEELIRRMDEIKAAGIAITDDAMVLETTGGRASKLVEASYENIKVTTPEDIVTAEAFLRERKK